jgi:Beta-lactamase superfamily domain
MRARWTVLASGSSGNASLLEVGERGLLLDAGLGPRQLAGRLGMIGVSWEQIGAVLLTHTHADHWNGKTLAGMGLRQIPLFCHRAHERELQLRCTGFDVLQRMGLIREYDGGRPFEPIAGVRCRPLPVEHDGGPTFGFRLEAAGGAEFPWAIGYAADLGTWDASLARMLADVDILALEFNHDIDLQRASGRAPWLIERVLGNHGHLSNIQGAELLTECLKRSTGPRMRHLIQLHLSRECNRPSLAAAAAQGALDRLGHEATLHTSRQDAPSCPIVLEPTRAACVA